MNSNRKTQVHPNITGMRQTGYVLHFGKSKRSVTKYAPSNGDCHPNSNNLRRMFREHSKSLRISKLQSMLNTKMIWGFTNDQTYIQDDASHKRVADPWAWDALVSGGNYLQSLPKTFEHFVLNYIMGSMSYILPQLLKEIERRKSFSLRRRKLVLFTLPKMFLLKRVLRRRARERGNLYKQRHNNLLKRQKLLIRRRKMFPVKRPR